MACDAAMSALISGLVLASLEPVTIGTDAPFPAYTFQDEAGTITGFERDVMDEICARAMLDCAWVDANFENLIPGLQTGRFDIVLGGMAITAERRLRVDFTMPYHYADDIEWFVGRPGAPEPEVAMVAVQSGTVHHDHLRQNRYRHRAYATEKEVLDALISGKADLAFGPYEAREDIDALLSANGMDFLYTATVPDEGVAMAVCKGNAALLARLNAALTAMEADGTLDRLETVWF
ncbi:MAG: amino acid ABC transporter substrate-binding protein [Tabrizicola sp.]|nr:amino acid ABC transporter substrate-binding protein [Tabrizicola sp.]